MFDRPNVALRINKVSGKPMEHDETDLTLLQLDCVIEPLSADLAAELDTDVRARLFSRTDANVNKKISAIDWHARELGISTQVVQMRMAPDQNLDSFTLAEAEVSRKLKTKQSSDGKTWRLSFSLSVHPASEHQAAQILESLGKVRYCSFEARQPDLFGPSQKKRTVAVRAEKEQGIGPAASAATH